MANFSRLAGGVLLVSGTAIGAGMLALPIITGPIGYLPSIALFILCTAFMAYSVLLLFESALYTSHAHRDQNMVTLVGLHLGSVAQYIASFSLIALLYSANGAYIDGGGQIIASAMTETTGWHVAPEAGIGLFVLVFGCVALAGTQIVDYTNRMLMIGLFASFLTMLSGFFHAPNWNLLTPGHPTLVFNALPVVILSFACQPIILTLCRYYNYEKKQLLQTIFLGCLLPLLFYLAWESLIIGVLPMTGDNSLVTIARSDYPLDELLQALELRLHVPWISWAAQCFSFFALVTSFLAVTLSMCDFLMDGLALSHKKLGDRCAVICLALLPPLFFAIFYPNAFVEALGFAGVFVSVLYIILPALMVWRARERYADQPVVFRAPGGRYSLVMVIVAALVVIGCEVLSSFNALPSP